MSSDTFFAIFGLVVTAIFLIICFLILRGIVRKILRFFNRNKTYTLSSPTSRYIPDHVRLLIMRRDSYLCRNCGSPDYPEIDHIIPFSKGGTNHVENLQVLCRKCNNAKRATIYTQRMQQHSI